jgi:hypothetical protein
MRRIKLTIVGTGVELDATGLPSALRGDIFYAGKGVRGGKRAGSYSETVEPIFDPDLRGTRGRSRLELDGGAVVTENLSLLAGTAPDGALLVKSTGKVVEGEGPFRDTPGTLESESRVRLTPFEMRVEVTLVMDGPAVAAPRSRRRGRIRPEAQ